MRKSRLHSSTQIFEAEWLVQRLRPFSEHRIASIVPDKFPAYVRILHPALVDDASVSWAEVAVRRGRSMHRLVQFHAIARLASASSSDTVDGIRLPDRGKSSS